MSLISSVEMAKSYASIAPADITLSFSDPFDQDLVGGLGLTGLMDIIVLERTREIGVMRAIGASHSAILQIFISEGLLIGFMS